MNKRWIVLAPFILLISFCFGQVRNKSRYWVNKNIDWKNPSTGDPEIDALVEASTVNAFIFHENGQFRMLSSNGGLGNDSIHQHADIFKIYSGNWKDVGNGEIDVDYTLVNDFGNLKSPIKTVRMDLKKAELEFEGIRYIQGSKLTQATKQRLENFATHSKSKKK